MGARGARGRLRAALPRHCTRVTHVQCNSNAPRGRPPLQAPTPAPAQKWPRKRPLPDPSPHPSSCGGRLGPEGGSRSSTGTQALARETRLARAPTPTVRLTPASSAAQGRTSRGWQGGDPHPRPARPPAPPLTLSMELPAGVVARLSCRYPLAFSQMARLAGPDSAFPRPSRARAALKECRAARGRGLLLGPGQRTDGQTWPRPSLHSPLPWFWLHGEERVVTLTAQKAGESERIWPVLTQTPAGHGAGAPPAGIAARPPPHRAAASGSPWWSVRPTTWPWGLCLQGARGVGGEAPRNSATLHQAELV